MIQVLTPPAISASQRLYHLDTARAVLLILGLPFHVATKAIFESDPAAIAFQTSQTIGGYLSVTHAFRMFAFFMLAGYFAGMMRDRKGAKEWLQERARRLGLPFAASLVSLGAIQFQLQDVLLHKPSAHFLGLPLALDHLWFLIVLLGYCACFAAVPIHRIKVGPRIQRAMLLRGPGVIVLVLVMASWGIIRIICERAIPPIPNAPIETLLWQQFIFHAAPFILGLLAWQGRIGDQVFALRHKGIWAAIALLLIIYIPLDPFIRPALGLEIYPDDWGLRMMRIIELPLAYLMSLAIFRILAKLVKGPNRLVTFIVNGALAIYLFHLLWAMIILPQARAFPLPPEVQWLLATGGVFALSILSYMAVRTTNLTSILFCGIPKNKALVPKP